MARTLSDDVFNFIVSHIHSVEELEVLLILQGEPTRSWTAHEVDERIRSHPGSIAQRLAGLSTIGLLEASGDRYRFSPNTPELAATAAALLAAYRSRRIEVIETIFTKPKRELVSFSNAFKLKGGKGNG